MATEHAWGDSVSVSSISEEYRYIEDQKCRCGGKFSKKMQALIFSEENSPFDLLTCDCLSCGKEKKFYFDISSFFGKAF